MLESDCPIRVGPAGAWRAMRCSVLIALISSLAGTPTRAAETVTYTYDALGRLVRAESAGNPNVRRKTEYTRDKASNRKRVRVTDAPR